MMVTKRWITLLLIPVLALFVIIYNMFDPEHYSFFPKCLFHLLTGYDCPGCGSQRALHHLLNLRIGKAFRANPLLILALPYIVIGIYFEYLGGKIRYPLIRKRLFGKEAIFIAATVIVAFWVGRNVISSNSI